METNRNLKNIKYYLPSDRSQNDETVKLDWNECNIPFNEDYLNRLRRSIFTVNLSEYPNRTATQNRRTPAKKSILNNYCNLSTGGF